MIGSFIELSVQTFQPLIVIYRSGYLVYNHWGCTVIYRPLSYPFRSLNSCTSYGSTYPCLFFSFLNKTYCWQFSRMSQKLIHLPCLPPHHPPCLVDPSLLTSKKNKTFPIKFLICNSSELYIMHSLLDC